MYVRVCVCVVDTVVVVVARVAYVKTSHAYVIRKSLVSAEHRQYIRELGIQQQRVPVCLAIVVEFSIHLLSCCEPVCLSMASVFPTQLV